MRVAITALFVAAAACGDNAGVALDVTPVHGDAFGGYQITLAGDVARLGDVESVTIGDRLAYDVTVDAQAGTITATTQGSPAFGAADIFVVGSRDVGGASFTFDQPVAGVPGTWAAFGASLTQGAQSLGVNIHSQLAGVSALIAKQAGVDLAMALFADGALPGLQLSDFTPDCVTTKNDEGDFINALFDVLKDPATGDIDVARARVDPTLTPRDVGVAGAKLSDILTGAVGNNALIERIVEEPLTTKPGDFLTPVTVSEIDRIATFDPDVGFATDIMANDVDNAVLGADDLHLDAITPLDQEQALLGQLAQRLGALHGTYFIANLPHLTFLPNVSVLRAQRIAAGTDTAQSFDAKVTQIDDAVDDYNAALASAIAPFPNLHVVDFEGQVEKIRATGVVAGGEMLTVAHFDGLLSLDDLHFTDTGYGVFANLFIDAMNAQLGTQIPEVDLDAVHATDALSPSKLTAAGFTCVP
nr:hypothetical protein [Kofleriaceae bacterium]